jgi:hypothetical protein
LGVESYYLPSAKMSSFCAYLTHRLHISDPDIRARRRSGKRQGECGGDRDHYDDAPQ